MDVNRRHLLGVSAAGAASVLAMSVDPARAAQLASTLGRDATQYGVHPGSPDDQTKVLQRAIDEAARAQVPLALPPGVYRVGQLRLQSGTQLVGVRGATRLIFNGGASMLTGEGASSIGLANITIDGSGIPLPTRRGLVHCLAGRDIRITDCEITGSGGNGIWLENASGDISGNIVTRTATTAIVSFDAQGLLVTRNTIQGTNDNGVEILRTAIGDDGTLVADNRIEDIKAGPGGSGQYGNAINAFRTVPAVAGVVAVVMLGAAVFSTFSLIIACIVKTRERFMGIGQVLTMPLFFASNAIYPVRSCRTGCRSSRTSTR